MNKIEVSILLQKFQNKNIASRTLKFALLKFKKYNFIAKVLKKFYITKFFSKNVFLSIFKKNYLLLVNL